MIPLRQLPSRICTPLHSKALTCLLTLGLVAGAGSARALDSFWTTGSDSWQSTTAWTVTGMATNGPPGATDGAWFTNAATYTVTLNASAQVGSNYFANASNTLATVSLNLSSFSLQEINTASPATLVIGDDATSTTIVWLASSTLAQGGLDLGSVSSAKISVGRNGIGTLYVTNGFVRVGASTVLGSGGGRGTLVITGPNTFWNEHQFSIGNNTNSFGNTLIVSNSASVTVSSSFRLGSSSGSGASSNNTMILDGAHFQIGSGHATIGNNTTLASGESYNNLMLLKNGGSWDCQNHSLFVGKGDQSNVGAFPTGNVLRITTGCYVTNVSQMLITSNNTVDLLGGTIDGTITNSGVFQGWGNSLGSLHAASNGLIAVSNTVASLICSNSFNLLSNSVLTVELGSTAASFPTIICGSNLQLRASTLNINADAGFGAGTYTLFTNTCACTNELSYDPTALAPGTVPGGFTYAILTNQPFGTVKLVVTGPPASGPFRIISIANQSGNVVLTWTSANIGATNVVQASVGTANGSYSNNFVDLVGASNVVSMVTNTFTDVGGGTNKPSRYYRIVQKP
jgi:hypothetical protein